MPRRRIRLRQGFIGQGSDALPLAIVLGRCCRTARYSRLKYAANLCDATLQHFSKVGIQCKDSSARRQREQPGRPRHPGRRLRDYNIG